MRRNVQPKPGIFPKPFVISRLLLEEKRWICIQFSECKLQVALLRFLCTFEYDICSQQQAVLWPEYILITQLNQRTGCKL